MSERQGAVHGRWVPGGGNIAPMLAIRHEVFVEEQGFSPDTDTDQWDAVAWHIILYVDETPAATARLFVDDAHEYHAGRIAVRKPLRGLGLGDLLMRMLLDRAQTLGARGVHIGAQLPVVAFYQKYGFMPCGAQYLDEGVPHLPLYIAAEDIRLTGACGACASCAHPCKEEPNG